MHLSKHYISGERCLLSFSDLNRNQESIFFLNLIFHWERENFFFIYTFFKNWLNPFITFYKYFTKLSLSPEKEWPVEYTSATYQGVPKKCKETLSACKVTYVLKPPYIWSERHSEYSPVLVIFICNVKWEYVYIIICELQTNSFLFFLGGSWCVSLSSLFIWQHWWKVLFLLQDNITTVWQPRISQCLQQRRQLTICFIVLWIRKQMYWNLYRCFFMI